MPSSSAGSSRPMPDLRVQAVLDPALCRGRAPAPLAAAAARGGATLVRLRDRRGTARELLQIAQAVLDALAPAGVPLVVDDRVDVVLAAGAKGVHLGRDDLPAAQARRLLGHQALIGVTIHHAGEADRVEATIADYVAIGPVFSTLSGRNETTPLGTGGLARLVRHLRGRLTTMPVCAIAGIDHGNAAAAIAAGADGIAAISDIFMAEDVEFATRRLRAEVDAALDRRPAPAANPPFPGKPRP